MTATSTTQTAPAGSWKALQASLPRETAGDRHPFYPIRDVQDGQTINLTVVAGPYFEGFHGSYSLVELDVKTQDGKMHRLCVSGARLAAALAAVEAAPGMKLAITATGSGKERTWSVKA